MPDQPPWDQTGAAAWDAAPVEEDEDESGLPSRTWEVPLGWRRES